MEDESASAEEAAADCPYINEYCREKHRSVVKCSWTPEKGRILLSERAFNTGDIIFREPPLHIVAEQKGNAAFERLQALCVSQSDVLDYKPLWYWTALCSLKRSQLAPSETRLAPISDDQQRKLLLLYHSEVTEPSEAAKLLVHDLELAPHLDPLDLERLLQIWILNCFEHSDDPLGYSTYFMSSFMSHSCLPNAVWHYEGDDFVLRARCMIAAQDEISVSYLSEDSLLESVPARRKHLRDSKHFVCTCARCAGECDLSRGFRCPQRSCMGRVFCCPKADSGGTVELVGVVCGHCQARVTEAEARELLEEERWLEKKLESCERRMQRESKKGNYKHTSLVEPLEEAVVRAERTLPQHWQVDRCWQLLADLYDRNHRARDAEATMRKRISFQLGAYSGLNGTRAWTLEALADMLLRHSGATLDSRVRVPDAPAARALLRLAVPVYEESLGILRLMFGEQHEYFTSVDRKASELQQELERLLGRAALAASADSEND
mmetsp:Transcript_27781/g.78644  ORF Transcript_27781/g.78644 Transcript_27781/m.78644 type:complete len:494 (-) Transcript_27781:167-1648(-)